MFFRRVPELWICLTKWDVAVSFVVLFSLGILSGVVFGGGTGDDVSTSSPTTRANPSSSMNPNPNTNRDCEPEH
jgi:hypothetical protein